MELRHIRYFLAVAEELHFGRAAERLNISQPPLSMQIQNLEEELQVKLFDRSRRQVQLTRCGERFLRRAKAILSEIDNAVKEVQALDRGEMDTISIGYKSGIMLEEITPLLKEFQKTYPGVRLKFIQASVAEQYQAVNDHRLDIGFIDAPVAEHSSLYTTEKITGVAVLKEKMMLAIPSDHPFSDRKSVDLSEIRSDPFIILSRQAVPSVYDFMIGLCQSAGFTPNIKYQAEQLTEVLTYVAAGYGVALTPEGTSNMWSGLIKFLPLKESNYVTISMIYRDDHESKAVQYFSDLLPKLPERASHK